MWLTAQERAVSQCTSHEAYRACGKSALIVTFLLFTFVGERAGSRAIVVTNTVWKIVATTLAFLERALGGCAPDLRSRKE